MKNKKIFVALGAIAVLAIVTLSVLQNKPKKKDMPKVVTDSLSLPSLVSINVNDQPLLWDYVYGSLGYHTSVHQTSYDPFFAIIYKPEKPDAIWISFYTWAQGLYLPSLGTEPQKCELNEQNKKLLEQWSASMLDDHKFKEGDWQLLIIEESWIPNSENEYDRLDSSYRWIGIDFLPYNRMDKYSQAYTEIYDKGLGFDTAWLRKDEWIEPLNNFGINIQDDFFDEWRLYSTTRYWKIGENRSSSVPITAYVENMDDLRVTDGGRVYNLRSDELAMMLRVRGYEKE